jgi:hypothetical protein
MYARFDVFTAVRIKFEVFWIVAPCSVMVGEHRAEDGGKMVLRNVGILPQHYTASQPKRPQIVSSLL